MSKMATRILFGSLMIVAFSAIFLLDWWLTSKHAPPTLSHLPLTVALLAIGVVAFAEFARLTGGRGRILPVSGAIGVAAVATMPYWWPIVERRTYVLQFPHVLAAMLGVLAAIFLEQMIRFRTGHALRRVAATMLAVVYLGAGGAVILWLRFHYDLGVLILFLAAVKCTDIGAYFTGSLVGRHKMILWLSPGKTWEGLVGGLAAGAGASMLAAWAMGVEGLTPREAAIFGVGAGAAGQFADLCESLLKRSARAKDSGALVPQFGGVLDIIDSPLLAGPAAVILLAILA